MVWFEIGSQEDIMVNSIYSSQQRLGVSFERQSRTELLKKSNGEQKSQAVSASDYLAFKMDLSRSLSIVEKENQSEIKKSLSMNFSFSMDISSFEARAQKNNAEYSDDPFSPENTAGRIVDFVKQAYKFTEKFGENTLESDEDIAAFREMQTDAVKEGFKQARGLLGNLPEDVESGVGKTFDLVMDGLDKFFENPDAAEEVDEASSKDPSMASYYSSKSFSLSFQLEMSAEGQFNQEQLDDYVQNAFQEVQDWFSSYLTGGDDESQSAFDPFSLFSLGGLNSDKIAALLSNE
jgi:hypothetical protein